MTKISNQIPSHDYFGLHIMKALDRETKKDKQDKLNSGHRYCHNAGFACIMLHFEEEYSLSAFSDAFSGANQARFGVHFFLNGWKWLFTNDAFLS